VDKPFEALWIAPSPYLKVEKINLGNIRRGVFEIRPDGISVGQHMGPILQMQLSPLRNREDEIEGTQRGSGTDYSNCQTLASVFE
jgi:hypothetical protein